jgi:hypothetical protein
MTDTKTYQHLRLRRVKSAPALYRAMRPTMPLHLSCRRRSHACAAPYSLHKSPPQRRWPHRIPGWKTCQTCDAGARRTVKVGASCPHACSCGEPRGKSLAKFQRAGEAAAIRPSEAAYQAWGQSRTHLMRNVNDAFVVAANSNGIRAEFVPLGDGMPRLPRPRKPPGRASRLQVRGPTGRQRRSLLTRLRDAAREENRFHQCARRR